MVGIIVIGLIGGVIAATVFAVIPWAQNNAAKQQLDSVASAESSYRGLSSSKDTNLQDAVSSPANQSDPNQVVLNSTFTGSAGLDKNNLLTLNTSGLYCVIATTDGKDYHAYSKSGSGQWYYATSGKTQPTEYTGTEPCLTTGTVNPAIDDGSGKIGTTPVTPAPSNPVIVGTYSFEDKNISGFSTTDSTIKFGLASGTYVNSGTYALSLGRSSSTSVLTGIRFDPTVTNPSFSFIPGKNYTVEAYLYSGGSPGYILPRMIAGGQTSATVDSGQVFKKVSVTFTADESTSKYIGFESTYKSSSVNGDSFRIDDITITQNN
jgi:type II secretory pathway pseudopilin PulG